MSLVDTEGREVGRGLSRLSALDAARVAGQTSGVDVVVHKDDLVLSP